MVFRRKGRPSYYFQGKTRTGYEQLCTFTPDRRLGEKIEGMWADIADRHRAWDVLERVLGGTVTPAELYDLWLESGRSIEGVRRRLDDQDLEPLVTEWNAAHAKEVKPDSAAHALAHVRWLLPEGKPLLASKATPAYLTERLSAYPGKRNTRRKVHSSWSGFLGYCVKPKGVLSRNPMDEVTRPTRERSPIRFYDLETVQRIVGWQPTQERRAYFALIYGTGMDVSDPLTLLRSDLNAVTQEIRAAGTKTHTRDRIAMVADWAWPILWEYAKDLHPDTPLFPREWNRWTLSDWHRQTIGEGVKDTHGNVVEKGLALPRKYPLKCARHHWAVRMLRAGNAVRLVSEQLGHASTQLTVDIYGAFKGNTDDRKRAEKQATKLEKEQRKVRQ
jgi:integrase